MIFGLVGMPGTKLDGQALYEQETIVRARRFDAALPTVEQIVAAVAAFHVGRFFDGVPPTSASRGRRTAARPGACRAFFRASPSTPARRAPLSGGSADQSHDILGREDVDVGPMVWTGFSTSVIQPVGRDLRSMLIESHSIATGASSRSTV